MKKNLLLIPLLVAVIPAQGQPIDALDFQSVMGATYRYSGILAGQNGTLEYRFFNYPQLGTGGTRVVQAFTGSNSSDNFNFTEYSVNGATTRLDYADSSISFSAYFDGPYSSIPRFGSMGDSFNSKGNYSYNAYGMSVTGSIESFNHFVAVEVVTTPVGTFEAVRVDGIDFTMEVYSGGWVRTSASGSRWYARGVGIVKQVVSITTTTSEGDSEQKNTNLSLSYASVPLAQNPVHLTNTWGKYTIQNGKYVDSGEWLGWLDVSNMPWVYSFSEGRYFYVPASSSYRGRGWIYAP